MKTLIDYWPFLVLIVSGLGGGAWVTKFAMGRAWLRDFLARVQVERRTVALAVEQTYVDAKLKGKRPESPGGVDLTKEEQAEALTLAVTRFLELLGLDAIDRALRLMGLPRIPEFVRRWATTHVEAAVKELSIDQVAANSGGFRPVTMTTGFETVPKPLRPPPK